MKTVSRSGVSVLLGVGCGLLVFSMLRNGVQAQESKDLVSIQARVLQDGVPTNVDLEVQFEVLDAATSGTLLWGPETQTCQIRNGILSAKLGAVVALGDTFKGGHSTSDRYVAIKVAGVEIVPRICLTAVPYSHRASSAEIASQLWSGSAGLSITDLDVRYVNNAAEIAGAGLEDDGSGGDGALRISSSAAGNGLTGGSGSALAVNPAALINGGVAVVNGDRLEIDFTPSNYTRTTGGEAADVKDLTAHLQGIDAVIGGGGGGGTVDRQTFNSSGTWNKPAFGTVALIECWGAGGGGGSPGTSSSFEGAGGGGGAYMARLTLLSALGATETVTVGAGGAAGAAGNNGAAGGNTTFGTHLTGYGGGGGGEFGTNAGGGGGGGVMGAGASGDGSNPGDGGNPSVAGFGGGAGGLPYSEAASSAYGGGGGGGATSSVGHVGGDSVWGGGGGGGAGGSIAAGGASLYGGAGGAAGAPTGAAGTAPGGGGGAGRGNGSGGSGIGGAGGAGRCVVTVW